MMGDSFRRWSEQLGVADWLFEQGDLSRWVIAAGLLVVLIISLRVLQAILGMRARKLAEKRQLDYAHIMADLIEATKFLFLVLMSASLSSLLLPLSDETQAIIRATTIIALLIQGAGLGIGGVAVALAAQNILGDLFASASIVLDKPFVMGDFVIVDDLLGTVECVLIERISRSTEISP